MTRLTIALSCSIVLVSALCAASADTPAPTQQQTAAARAAISKMIDSDKILFIKRFTYTSNHYYTEYINSSWRPGGGLDLTGRMTTYFSASYENLIKERRGARKDQVDPGLAPTIGENHPKAGNTVYLPARSLGSHNSLLIAMLLPEKVFLTKTERLDKLIKSHKKVKLTPAELLKISNWVDTNAQYYGSYYGRRNLQYKDHKNFRPVPSWDSARGIPPLPEDER